ncbi:hypothetical protein EHS25_003325 [Saitozyma podzolica]|uniref:D-3-phosphoglycerate dehydrogenase n=1 Tax=Saitozyma podzolica TaxID=1890683 RepID=A0A427Y8N7_9TREE|nr:hypothetical protein EHS25_003325 [Saitozyma podzolica]
MSPAAVPVKPRVFALYYLEPSVVEHARTLFDFTAFNEPGSKNWRSDAEGIMVRSENITEDDVAKLGPGVKYVVKHGVGTDLLAMKALKERGVTVMNTAGVNAGAVAELALALMMTLARNIPAIDRRVRAGHTVDKAAEGAIGIQLTGRTLGIVGGGNIGYTLAKMFHGAFGGKIYLFDPYLSPASAQKWADLLPTSHFQKVERVDDMLPHIDVLSLHVPLLDSTRGLIGEKQLRAMKKNEEALTKALDEGWIAAAGIDAYAIEPPTLAAYPNLVTHDRVLSTPHIGAASLDVIRLTAMSVIDHLHEAFSGKPLRDVCNP